MSLFCYALLCGHSSFAIILTGCLAIIVLQMYFYYKCSVALPRGAVGWSTVCDCGDPDHTHLLFFKNVFNYVVKFSWRQNVF